MLKRFAFAMTVMAIAMCCTIVPFSSARADSPDAALVKTQDGPVRGVVKEGVRAFFGIPYAAPPVGNLRWKPPVPHAAWSAALDATHPGDACAQILPAFVRAGSSSEDCLYLNVYTPNPPATGLPVMVWIHGGSFLLGTGATYDGSALATKGRMVVVTINYRLGALGFLAQKSLDAESPDHASGDYGLLDQQAALQWVQRNIGAFGGDPNKVTAAGESAGGISVCLQLESPAASVLFQRAIIESGPCLRQRTLAEAEARGDEFADKLGCAKAPDVAACMRSKSTSEVLTAIPANALSGPPVWNPIVDGHVVPKQPEEAFKSGSFRKMPVINGSNRNEGTLFLLRGAAITADQYAATTRAFYPQDADRVLAAYPLSNYASPVLASAAQFGDWIFSCPVHGASRLWAAQMPVYAYEFNDPDAPNIFLRNPPFPMGAYHGSEIQYVFQTRSRIAGPLSAEQQKLSDQMFRYWSSFIASGDPDGTAPPWTPYKAGDDKILSLAPGAITYESDFVKVHHCDLWDSIHGN